MFLTSIKITSYSLWILLYAWSSYIKIYTDETVNRLNMKIKYFSFSSWVRLKRNVQTNLSFKSVTIRNSVSNISTAFVNVHILSYHKFIAKRVHVSYIYGHNLNINKSIASTSYALKLKRVYTIVSSKELTKLRRSFTKTNIT